MRRALTNSLLVDGTGAPGRSGMTVVLDGDTIAEVSHRRELEPDVDVVDLEGKTVMPGLIDCHIHFALWALNPLAHQDEAISYLTGTTFAAMREVLEAGCTAARDPGGLDSGFKNAVDQGVCPGPRLQTSITIVSPINGIVDGTKSQGLAVPYLPGMPTPDCTGPWSARAKVREVLRAGADFIKIAVSGGVSSRRVDPQQQLFTEDEVTAIIDEAHSWGVPVICHALGGPGPLMAVRAGVDTIEHGGWLDDECLREMAERGTWYVPTFAVYEWHATKGVAIKQNRAREMKQGHLDSFRRAREAGVRIAAGSDAGEYGHDFTLELDLLVQAGMSASEAIVAGTSQAADCLGWSDEIGTVKPGMKADLLVLRGDPTVDIALLRDRDRVECVIKSGVAVTTGWGPPGRSPGRHQ